jgi:hypothetical protein
MSPSSRRTFGGNTQNSKGDSPTGSLTSEDKRRYPGVHSFGDNAVHRLLFRGRDQDKYDLLQLVLAERLVVLFARSGLGKSSLIAAGLMQPLRDRGFFPMILRVGAADDPVSSVYQGIKIACAQAIENGQIEKTEPQLPADWNRTSFWHFFKSFYIWPNNQDQPLEPVIIIDQFEELFTIVSEEPRKHFIRQLADLVRGTRPTRASQLPDAEFGDRPPQVKVLLSMREDFLAHLQEMAEYLPAILETRLRLAALRREDARRAIVEPAAFVSDVLDTPPFAWSDDAIQHALDFLCRRISISGQAEVGNEVEPFQLQLICHHVEDLVRERSLTTVSDSDLGGEKELRGILTHFYQDTIDKLCSQFRGFRLRHRLERLCEHGLITSKGRRLLREETTIHESDHVSPDVLAAMVESRLIRKEPRVADNYYELAHDTLIEPILASRHVHERQTTRLVIGTGGGVLAVVLVAVASLVWDLVAEPRRELALRLAQHGNVWRQLGNEQLSGVFHNEAVRLDDGAVQVRDSKSTAGAYYRTRADDAILRADAFLAEFPDVRNIDEDERSEVLTTRDDLLALLIEVAERLAARGDTADAVKLFEKGRELARKYQALSQGAHTVRDRSEDEITTAQLHVANLLAEAAYAEEANALYRDVAEVSVTSWNTLCWSGGLFLSDPSVVVDACDRAVPLTDSRTESDTSTAGGNRDSRGVVKARTGDLATAMGDFQAYLAWAPTARRSEEEMARRRNWVQMLARGTNPFDDGELQQLGSEERYMLMHARDQLLRNSLPRDFVEASLADLLLSWTRTPAVLDQLAQNRALCDVGSQESRDRCDQRWTEGVLPGMTELESNGCSSTLRSLQAGMPALAEIFVTDASGRIACLSNKTSDYYQADEGWWEEGKSARGFTYEYDTSAVKSSASVYLPVHDRQEFLGVTKAVFDLEKLAQRPEEELRVRGLLPWLRPSP